MKRWLALAPIVVLAALGIFLMTQMDRMAGDPAAGPTYKPDALVGQPIPETTVLPILADGKVGRSWGTMHHISFDNEDRPVLPKGVVL